MADTDRAAKRRSDEATAGRPVLAAPRAILAGAVAAAAVAAAFKAPEAPGVVVLFDGSSWDGWQTRDGRPSPWTLMPDGSVQASGEDAVSAYRFKDYQLHVEFMCPEAPDKAGQARSNSGVYLQGEYEIQVLDSWGQPPAANGCGAVYSIAAPLVNASLPPGQWQRYDIVFHAARPAGADGAAARPARVTVLHNGLVIHDNLPLPDRTPGGLGGEVTSGPLMLQFHGDPVRYRNIWTRPLPE